MSGRPDWLRAIEAVLPEVTADRLTRTRPPVERERTRAAAVLILFGGTAEAGDLLLIERAATMRSHPGQVAFPGGAVDPGDDGVVGAALREAREETRLDPAGVEVLGTLPELYLPPSRFLVTPVVGWWREPGEVAVGDPAEVARVARVPLDALLDPANRWTVRHPSGFVGPAFTVDGLFVWGFTAGLLSRLLAVAGLERPWDVERVHPLPARYAVAGQRDRVLDEDPQADVVEDYEPGEVQP